MAVLALLALGACGNDSPTDIASEYGEEAADLRRALEPDAVEAGEVTPPAPAITVEETLAGATAAGGLLKLSPAAATAVIDRWVVTLTGNPTVDDADDLRRDLGILRELLAAPTVDGDAVAEVLEDLAEETGEAADDADSALVEKLAEALEAAADALD